jgi:hypothetical protein
LKRGPEFRRNRMSLNILSLRCVYDKHVEILSKQSKKKKNVRLKLGDPVEATVLVEFPRD